MNFVVLVVLGVRSHSYDEKRAPGFENLENLLVQSSSVDAWQAASMAYAPSKVFALKTLLRSMKLPCTISVRSDSPASLLSFLHRPTWYSLMVIPVTCPPVALTDVAHGTSHAAADVKRLHAGFQADRLRDGWNRSENKR